MSRSKTFILSAVIAMIVWAFFSWPLPAYLFSGIPASSRNIEQDAVRAMMPSDQLQLMYHYWLFQDMMAGQTPWFHNLYEFNTGNDADRFWPSAYFFPFSFVCSVAAMFGGPAFGMNMVGLFSLWLTLYFSWRLLQRFVDDTGIACVASLFGVILPYRWATQLGGSPSGYAMVYVPMVVLGLDIAVREKDWKGGLLAGIAILLACWGDLQVFAFCVLSIPFWCLLSLLLSGSSIALFKQNVKAWCFSFLPVFVGTFLAFGHRFFLQPYITSSTMGGGRTLAEIALFSPHWEGLFSWVHSGVGNHIYIGYLVPTLLLGVSSSLVARGFRNRMSSLHLLGPMLFTMAGIFIVCILALGPNGPFSGGVFHGVRLAVPGYDLIRQPAKVFCLMPTLVMIGVALALLLLSNRWPQRRSTFLTMIPMLALVEFGSQVRPTINLLDPGQGAYYAMREDASGQGENAHAVVLPLWPGDSDQSSVYEYYASLYRIRLVNGYSPLAAKDYFETVFRRFESLNQGFLSDRQSDELLEMGVHYLLLHENLFPERVSPFPVTTTIRRLLTHPRLELLRQSESVWAFRILSVARVIPKNIEGTDTFFPTRWQELERPVDSHGMQVGTGEGSRGAGYAILAKHGTWLRTRPFRTGPVSRLRWEVRVRGQGVLQANYLFDGASQSDQMVTINTPAWEWKSLLIQGLDRFGLIALELRAVSGCVEADVAYLTAGLWPKLDPGQRIFIPGAAFFHAGFSDSATGAVTLRKRYEPAGEILYGPVLPLEPGSYVVDLRCKAELEPPESVGILRCPDSHVTGEPVDIVPEISNAATFHVVENLPVRFVFDYKRTIDLTVEEMILHRVH